MNNPSSRKLVLAFDVRPRRFGFVAFEGPNQLLDWGIRSFFSGPSRLQADKKVLTLINDLSPSVIVVRERQGQSDPKVLKTLRREATRRNIPLRLISQKAIMKAFAGTGKNKHEVSFGATVQYSHVKAATETQMLANRGLPDEHLRRRSGGGRLLPSLSSPHTGA